MNFGYFSRLSYDKGAYEDKLFESTYGLGYKTNIDQIYNKDGCFYDNGPNTSFMGVGISSPIGNVPAQAQKLIDVDSLMSNRNVKRSKLKKGRVNDIDINKFEYKHFPNCKKSMETIQSRMELPAMMYRDIGIDRFYDLPRNPQKNIFWDFSVESRNDAKDKYMPQKPRQIDNSNMFMLDY